MQSFNSASNASLSVKLVSFGTQLGRIVVIGGAEEGKVVSDTNSKLIHNINSNWSWCYLRGSNSWSSLG